MLYGSGSVRVVLVGGNANNGANAGTFTFNGNNSSGNRNRNISAQHAVFSKLPIPAASGRAANMFEPIALGRATEERGEQQR